MFRERVGLAIHEALYYREMTTEDLARRVGVGPETVRRWGRAETSISAFHAASVVRELALPPDLLMEPPASRGDTIARIRLWDRARQSAPRPA